MIKYTHTVGNARLLPLRDVIGRGVAFSSYTNLNMTKPRVTSLSREHWIILYSHIPANKRPVFKVYQYFAIRKMITLTTTSTLVRKRSPSPLHSTPNSDLCCPPQCGHLFRQYRSIIFWKESERPLSTPPETYRSGGFTYVSGRTSVNTVLDTSTLRFAYNCARLTRLTCEITSKIWRC